MKCEGMVSVGYNVVGESVAMCETIVIVARAIQLPLTV